MAKLTPEQLFSDKKIYGGMTLLELLKEKLKKLKDNITAKRLLIDIESYKAENDLEDLDKAELFIALESNGFLNNLVNFNDVKVMNSKDDTAEETLLTDKKGESKATRQGNMIAVHFDSDNKKAFEQLSTVLTQAKEGDIIGGDFNINFADQQNWDSFKSALKEAGYRIEVSPEAIDNLQLTFKKRSEGLEINQQPFKAGLPDVFVKDLAFKIVKKNNNESVVDSYLDDKMLKLIENRTEFLREYDNLTNKTESGKDVNDLCNQKEVINYHNLEKSHGDDHPSTYYIDDEKTTIYYFKNSVKHQDYEFDQHFKEGVTEDQYKEAYKVLNDKIFNEMMVQMGSSQSYLKQGFNYFFGKNNTEKPYQLKHKEHFTQMFQQAFCKDGTLTESGQKHVKNFVQAIYTSEEFIAVNDLLANRFTQDEISAIITNLPEDPSIAQRPDKLINAIFQHGKTSQPVKEDKTLSLSGTGFAPFKGDNGNIISADDVHQRQIENEEKEIKDLAAKYPQYNVVVAQIEAKGQDIKLNAVKKAQNYANSEVKINNSSEVEINNSNEGANRKKLYTIIDYRDTDATDHNKGFINALIKEFDRVALIEYKASSTLDKNNDLASERQNKLNAMFSIFESIKEKRLLQIGDLKTLKENTGLGKNFGINAESYNALYQYTKDYQVKTTFDLLAKHEEGFDFNTIDSKDKNYNSYQKEALNTIKSIYTEVIQDHFDQNLSAVNVNKNNNDARSSNFGSDNSSDNSFAKNDIPGMSLCKLAKKIGSNEKVNIDEDIANDIELSQTQQSKLKKPIERFNTYSVDLTGGLIKKLTSQKERILQEIQDRRNDHNNSHLDSRLRGLKDMKVALSYKPESGKFSSEFMDELIKSTDAQLKKYNVNVHRGGGFFGMHNGVTTSFQNLSQAVKKIESRYAKSDDRLKSSAAKEINKAIDDEIYRLEPGYKKIAEIDKVIDKLAHGKSISIEDKGELYKNRTSFLGQMTSTTKKETDHLIQAYNEMVNQPQVEVNA